MREMKLLQSLVWFACGAVCASVVQVVVTNKRDAGVTAANAPATVGNADTFIAAAKGSLGQMLADPKNARYDNLRVVVAEVRIVVCGEVTASAKPGARPVTRPFLYMTPGHATFLVDRDRPAYVRAAHAQYCDPDADGAGRYALTQN
jgi:hypothetical protein